MSSKFKVHVEDCTGAVVIGDHASLTIGAPVAGGKFGKFSFPVRLIELFFRFWVLRKRVEVGRDGSEDSN